MARLLVHVEGETEETFVNEVLTDHLCARGYFDVSARIVGNSRQRDRRGGIKPWSAVRRDIIGHLRQDGDCIVTTMVDFYGLPKIGERAWPGRNIASKRPFHQRGQAVESAIGHDIAQVIGLHEARRRFVPFVVMHEFEGLLFSDCEAFARAIGQPDLGEALLAVRGQFATPEEINDSAESAPSKRVTSIIEKYQKPLMGAIGAIEIGLPAIRQECPHFAEWLDALEAIGSGQLPPARF